MGVKVSRIRDQLADREAIRETLLRYARLVDRVDVSLADEVFWEDATDDHAGAFKGPVRDLLDAVLPALADMRVTQHFLMNMIIEIDGASARTETYVVAYHELGADEQHACLIGGGRLLDVLAKKDDEWRVESRHLLIDWMKKIADVPMSAGDLGAHQILGTRKPDDPSYSHFASGGER